MNRFPSYDELRGKFDALMAHKRYEKAWHLCQAYSLSKVLDDFSFTFSIDAAKVGLLAGKAAEMAGAPRQAYVDGSVSALIIKNEINIPTKYKEQYKIDILYNHLSEAEKLLSDSYPKMSDHEKTDATNEIEQIRVRVEQYKNINIRLLFFAHQNIGMNFIERLLLRRRLKKMYKLRRLR